MAPGGGLQDELLEGVRALLLGQRRLEQLVARLAPGAAAAGGGGVDAFPPLPLPEGAERELLEEPPSCSASPAKSARREASRRLLDDLVSPAASMSWLLHDRDAVHDTRSIESKVWLERVEVREELVKCGSSEALEKECSRHRSYGPRRTLRSSSVASVVSLSGVQDLAALTPTSASERVLSSLRLLRPGNMVELLRELRAWLSWSRLSRSTVLSPSSTPRAWLDAVSLLVLLYNLSSIPYFFAFQVDNGASPWVTFEYVSASFWFVDLLVSFRTGYYADGHLHMEPWKIARRYLRSSFFLDLLTLLIDVVSIVLRALENESVVPAAYIRTFKIVRVFRLAGVTRVRNLHGILDRLGNSYHVILVKAFTGSLYNICKFALALVWVNHTIACFWCFLGREDPRGSVSDTGFTWMDTGDGLAWAYSHSGRLYQYTTAFHWALTQMTPGSMQVFPVNSVERIFNIICLIGGLLVFSALVSAISASAAQLKIDMQGHSREMERLIRFLHRSHIEPELRMQVCKQIRVKLVQRRPEVIKDLSVLGLLSLSLRHALQLALCNPHLLEHPLLHFLSIADAAMWEEICMRCAHFSVLVKRDSLFVFGAEAEGIYFVVRGPLSYDLDKSFPAQTSETKQAETGSWLSEAALWCHWRHMGCAEAKDPAGAGCCEVLFLQADALIPILTKRGLIGQLAWAYARGFLHFLQKSAPPLCDWPNDLVLPFGVDEVIAAMPKEATAVIGQVAIDVLMAPPESLLDSWLHAVPQGNIQRLASEVMDGGSTLLAIGRRVIVRCVPLVALRLRHQDGRIFVRMKLDSRADGGLEASCKLPGGKQEAGESPHDCLRRLLRGKLRALRDGIAVVGVERQSQQDNSRKFGVPTRYVRTVVLARWQGSEGDTAALGQLKVHTVDTTLSVASEQHGYGSGEDVASESLAKKPRAKCEKKTSLGIGAQAFMLPEDVGFYTWLTEDQFDFAKSPQGQQSLIDWLSVLYSTVGLNPDVPVEKDAWKRACLSNAGSGKGLGEYELGEEPGSPAALSRRGDVDDPPTAMSDLA